MIVPVIGEDRAAALDGALRRLRREMLTSGTLRELRRHTWYEKPSERRRRKRAAGVRRARRLGR